MRAMNIPASPRLLALGDSAWTVEFGHAIDAATNARVMGLTARVAGFRSQLPLLASVTDLVPTFRSLTVHFDPWTTDAEALGAWLLAQAGSTQAQRAPGRRWLLPVCFDADFAPDLPRLCEAHQLSRDAVIEQLLTVSFHVYMIGFQPGFPYMGGLPAALNMPRLPSPRQKVPAQSVAITGEMCAVYPWESPGGWNLVGRTPVALFDPRQPERPAMLSAGDEVRWTEVDRQAHDRLVAEIARGLPREHFLKGASA
jgi:inhibitor of KinA